MSEAGERSEPRPEGRLSERGEANARSASPRAMAAADAQPHHTAWMDRRPRVAERLPGAEAQSDRGAGTVMRRS